MVGKSAVHKSKVRLEVRFIGRTEMSRIPGKTSKINAILSVLKTDTGGLVEYTKANGRTLVKELGKTTRRNFGRCLPSPTFGCYNRYMWIVYLIQNNLTLEIYIGVTLDLKKRIKTHNAAGKKFTTRKNGEWILIYAEAYRSKGDAMLREKRLKNHGSGKRELYKRLKESSLIPKSGAGRS
jgi:putative endonuclease